MRTITAATVLSSLLILSSCHVRVTRSMSGVGFSTALVGNEQAEKTERLALRLGGDAALAVHTRFGKIRVSAGVSEPHVEASFVARAATRERAEEILEGFRLVQSRGAGVVTVEVAGDPIELKRGGGTVQVYPAVHLTVVVPKGTRVRAKSGAGDLELVGPFGATEAESDYGKVSVRDVRGDLIARSSSGTVVVKKARDGSVDVRSGYGNLELTDVNADAVEAKTGSGKVSLHTVFANRIRVHSDYGNVRLEEIEGDLDASSGSGVVHLAAASAERFELKSGYGDIIVEGARGDLTARTSSGNLKIETDGAVRAESSYGKVRVTGALTSLTARSESGAVEVQARDGTSQRGPWELHSGYGSLSVTLPAGFSCDLHAHTDYGTVECGFPVLLEPGKHDKKSLRGRIGDGGHALKISTSSGNIRIRRGG